MNPWTIPFEGINYVCWTDRRNKRRSRQMTPDEERAYFTSKNKDTYLYELLSKG